MIGVDFYWYYYDAWFMNIDYTNVLFINSQLADVIVTLRGYLAQFAMSRKANEHPICSFLVKLKIVSKWT